MENLNIIFWSIVLGIANLIDGDINCDQELELPDA
jgi:hypothetical protein